MKHTYFWGHEDGPDYPQGTWHIFDGPPDERGYPDDGRRRFALCGVEWSYLAATRQPPIREPHCRDCMDALHQRSLRGEA